ncbi:SDR family NAD(P)-dependent oxidoreductase, partial [Streptomyces vulcanius]
MLDRPSLTEALNAVKARFGAIDVLDYFPAPHSPVPGITMAAPSEVTVDNLQPQIEYNFYGAVAAARTVLSAMREAGAGTLLFTTGGGSINPNPMLGNVSAAAAALRNWVLNLHNELAGSGVYAAHVAISAWIGDGGPEGIPAATPAQIAPPVLGALRAPRPARGSFHRLIPPRYVCSPPRAANTPPSPPLPSPP